MFNETLNHYLNAMGALPRLPPEQDATATEDELVKGNLRLVVKLAKRWARHTSEDLLDLIQDGNIGLIIAAERYDPARGPFGSYAGFHIRKCITEGQIVMSRTVRLPGMIFKSYRKIKELQAQGRNAGEIAKELDLRPCAVVAALSYGIEDSCDYQGDCHQSTPEGEAEDHMFDKRIKRRLTPKQQSVVRRTLQGYEVKEISVADNLSHQAVRQLKKAAIERLKRGPISC